MPEKTGIVYVSRNIINNKYYIGQTCRTFNKRQQEHFQSIYKKDRNFAFTNALRKYGIENFVWDILYEGSISTLDKMEMKYINEYNSLSPNGYNLTSGGNKNKFLSDATKEKLSVLNIGKTLSNETKQKISIYQTGKIRSDETKQKMKEHHTKPMLGKKLTKEHKEKIRKGGIGKHRKYDEEIENTIHQLRNNGLSFNKISNILGIYASTVHRIYKRRKNADT